jgi:hypothetical protein
MKTKKIAEQKIDNSNMTVEPIFGQIAQDAFNVYQKMLNASSMFNKQICSLCAKSQFNRSHFHGSEFGACYRQVQYNLVNPKIYFESDNINNIFLYDGHLHEQAAIELLSKNYNVSHHDQEIIVTKKVEVGLQFEKEITVICHPDLLIEMEGQTILLEFKAVKDWGIKNKFSQRLIPKSYYGQCQIYMEALNLDLALLIFKSRHTSEIFPPFIIKRDPIYIRKRFAYLVGILASISGLEVVPREYNNKDCDACKFCKYYNACWL